MTSEVAYLVDLQSVVFSTPWMIALVVFFARWLILANVLVVAALLFAKRPRAKLSTEFAIWSGLLALLLTTAISRLLQRPRPFLADADIILLIPPPFNTSFPSGHTATAVAIACAIYARHRTAGMLSFLIAAFVAYGRMATGVHYPTDIAGSLVVGFLAYGIVHLIARRLRSTDLNRAAARHHHP